MSNLSKNDPQNIEQNFDELELVAEKAGELNDRVGKIESELGAQTKTLESAALVLDAAIKGLGALKSSVLENDIGALQLALNDKTAHLAREIGRFESAVAEIDRRAESGDDEIKAALLATAQSLRAQFDAKSAEIGEWSARVEKEIAAHAVALAAIPPIIKGADAVGFNPVGEWETGKAFARMDVVSYAGSSYISNVDGNTEKPSKSKNYTVLSKRAGSIGSGGVGGFAELTGTILPAQVVPGSATYAVGDVLYAGTTGALSKLGAGSSGQLLSTQGAGAAPIWVTATGGAGDMNGPASATDNAIVRFDGTGGKTVQNSAVTIADTTGDIAGASSLTAPASTALTLTGGSTGASLVLGQGASAAATLAMPGVGIFTVSNVNDAGFVNVGRFLSPSISGGNSALILIGKAAASNQSAFLNYVYSGTAASTRLDFGHNGTTGQVSLTQPGNLLIGTTTDMTGSGGLKIAGTTAATTTTSGALIVAGGVGVSGAGYFGGQVVASGGGTGTTMPLVASNVTLSGLEIYSGSASADQKRWQWQAGTAVGDGTLRLRAVNDTVASGSNAISITRTAEAIGTISLGTTAAIVSVLGTTAANSSTVGALTIGNGTAATNVAIGGGNVNAGGTSTAAQFFTGTQGITSGVSSAFAVGATSATTADVLSFGATARSGLLRGYHDGGGTITWQFGRYAGSFENWAELTGYSLATSGLKLYGTSASTGSTSGALQVAGGIYAGAASVFGSTAKINGTGSADSPLHVYESAVAGTGNGVTVEQAGAGDAAIQFLLTGVQRWSAGIDNSDSDSFVIGTGALGSANVLKLATTGAATFAGAVTVGGTHTISSAAPYQLLTATAGTNYAYTEYVNTGNNLRFGLENSAGASIVPGAPAYSAFVASVGARPLVFATNNIVRQTIDSTGAAAFAGAVTIAGTVIHTLSATPASASATGTVGTMSWDASYIYICTATNTWKRVAIATW